MQITSERAYWLAALARHGEQGKGNWRVLRQRARLLLLREALALLAPCLSGAALRALACSCAALRTHLALLAQRHVKPALSTWLELRPALLEISEDAAVQRVCLRPSDQLEIGRGRTAARLHCKTVSRQHLIVQHCVDGLHVQVVGKCGVSWNGRHISKPRSIVLPPSERIWLDADRAQCSLRYEYA